MIGKIYSSTTPYYDLKSKTNKFKKRPVLVIGNADKKDLTVLPISTVTKKENLHKNYDIEITPSEYPKLNLKKTSYIRTHKQTVVHISSIKEPEISDLKSEYPDLFLSVLEKLEDFNNSIIENAL